MRKITLAFILLFSVAFPQVLIDVGTTGCNNFGGHTTQAPLATITQNWCAANGLWYTTVGDAATYGNLPPQLYTLSVYIQTSGDGVIDGPAELNFFLNARTCKLFGHASAGDTERINSTCGDIDPEYIEQGSGAGLRNSGKHSNIQNEVMYIDVLGLNHPIFNGIGPGPWSLVDEWYWLGPTVVNSTWDSKNVILARIQKYGPGTEDVPVIWEMVNDSGDTNIAMSFGHTNGIITPGDVRYEIWMNSLNYLHQSCSGPLNIFANREPVPIDMLPHVHNYIWFDQYNKQINLNGFEKPFTDTYVMYDWIDIAGNVVSSGEVFWAGETTKVNAPNEAFGIYIFSIRGTQYSKKVIIR